MSNNNSNFINVVTDFGADNTGSNDTSAALIAAFESISATGGTVFFPNGVYLIGKNTGMYVEFYSNTHMELNQKWLILIVRQVVVMVRQIIMFMIAQNVTILRL